MSPVTFCGFSQITSSVMDGPTLQAEEAVSPFSRWFLAISTIYFCIGGLAIGVQGPGISGGGDITIDPPPAEAEVRQSILDARKVVPFVLNSIETLIVSRKAGVSQSPGGNEIAVAVYSLPSDMIKKMFPWPNPGLDIHARLAKIKFKIEEKESCLDGLKIHKAASAFPIESSEICFSIAEIQKQTRKSNLNRKVVALMLHELLHKQDIIDEEQVKLVEKLAEAHLPSDPLKLIQHQFSKQSKGSGQLQTSLLELMMTAGNTALKLLSQSSNWDQVCLQLGLFTGLSQGLQENFELKPFLLQLNRPSSLAKTRALILRGAQLSHYCSPKEAGIRKTFGSASEIQFQKMKDPLLTMLNQKLRRPSYRDVERLRLELKDSLWAISMLKDMFRIQTEIHLEIPKF